jgi:hypothetical protein
MAHRAPAWMENLVEVISECVEAQSPMGPLGYRYLVQNQATFLGMTRCASPSQP